MVKENFLKTQQAQQTNRRFRVGDKVTFQFVYNRLTGVVVEDRGTIGAGGRHLYRVEAPFDGGNPLVTELPADELQPA